MSQRILLAGDDVESRESLAADLGGDGYEIDTASSMSEALDLAKRTDYAVSVLDFDRCACEALAGMHDVLPHCFFLLLVRDSSLASAIPVPKMVALEFAVKPCRFEDIAGRIGRMIEFRNLQSENAALREQLARQSDGSLGPSIAPGISLSEMERLLLTATIRHTGGNIKAAASILGIDRSTLYEKIKRYGIPR